MCLNGSMTDICWTPDRTDSDNGGTSYSVVLCVEANDTLYVVMENPVPPADPSQFVKMTASVPGSGELSFRGQASSSQARGQMIVGRFEPAPADTPVIEVRMVLNDAPIFQQSAHRRSIV
jgi:hypothetical protein